MDIKVIKAVDTDELLEQDVFTNSNFLLTELKDYFILRIKHLQSQRAPISVYDVKNLPQNDQSHWSMSYVREVMQ